MLCLLSDFLDLVHQLLIIDDCVVMDLNPVI